MSQAHERRRAAIYLWAAAGDHESYDVLLSSLREVAQARDLNVAAEYVERTSKTTRPGSGPAYRALMAAAYKREFDVILVYRYEHVARTQQALLNALKTFQLLGIDFVSHEEGVDTTTPEGATILTFMASLRQFDDTLSKSIRAGMTEAKAQGKRAARPPIPEGVRQQIKALYEEEVPINQISKRLGIAYGTAWNYVQRLQEDSKDKE